MADTADVLAEIKQKRPSNMRYSSDILFEAESDEEVVGSKSPVTSYRMKPATQDIFPATQIKNIIQVTLYDKLQGKVYNPEEARKWTREISDEVSLAIKEKLQMPRFKLVVQTFVGQQLGAGCRYIAKCCWDAEADGQTSDVFTNASIFCVCTVFGVYLY